MEKKIYTHYQKLNLNQNCTDDEIEQSYKKMVAKCYEKYSKDEDKETLELVLKKIKSSYETLINPISRTEHDKWIKELTKKNTFEITEDAIKISNEIIHTGIDKIKNKINSIDLRIENKSEYIDIDIDKQPKTKNILKSIWKSYTKYFLDILRNRYADFSHRGTREEYWMFHLCYSLNVIIFLFLMKIFFPIRFLFFFYLIALGVPLLAIAVRRMHDIGRSGWWILMPIVGFVFLFVKSQEELNEYDDGYKTIEVKKSYLSIDELEKYALLHKQGIITDEEFKTKKDEIMSKI